MTNPELNIQIAHWAFEISILSNMLQFYPYYYSNTLWNSMSAPTLCAANSWVTEI